MPAQAPDPSGDTAARLRACGEAPEIAGEHFGKSVEDVRQEDGLRAAQVRARGDDGAGAQELLRAVEKSEPEPADTGIGAADRSQRPEPQVERHLVVAGAPGVDAAPGVAGQLDQATLDVQVNVFVRVVVPKTSRRHLPSDAIQALFDAGKICPGQEACPLQAPGVRAGTRDVVSGETPVEGVRQGNAGQGLARGLRVRPRPQGFGALPGLCLCLCSCLYAHEAPSSRNQAAMARR